MPCGIQDVSETIADGNQSGCRDGEPLPVCCNIQQEEFPTLPKLEGKHLDSHDSSCHNEEARI
jgi:hypothetical protein